MQMTIELAEKLLATFNHPVSWASQGYEVDKLKGGFISNKDYFTQPHCSCGYSRCIDGYAELCLEWTDIEGFDDTEIQFNDNINDHIRIIPEGYDNPQNWNDTVRFTKKYLKAIISGEIDE